MSETLVAAKRHDGKTQITLGPILDVANSGDFRKQLEKMFRRKAPFELDGSAVERVDTAGLQVLLAFSQEARNRDIGLQWLATSDALKTASSFLGLSGELGIDE